MKKIFILLLLTIFCSIFLVTAINAATFKTGEIVIIPSHKTIPGNLYVAGKKIYINGKVNGDIFAVGEYIKIRGRVKGDISAIGKHLYIAPKYANDLRLAGQEIYIRGKTYNEVLVAGQFLSLGGNVLGNVYATAQNLKVNRYARIGGVLKYSAKEAEISSQARIKRIIRSSSKCTTPKVDVDKAAATGLAAISIFFFVHLLILLIFGALLLKFTPNQIKLLSKEILSSPWKSIGIGFATLFLTPLAIFLLMVTVLGIPFALILVFFYTLAIYLSKIFISFAIGDWFSTKFKKRSGKKKKAKQHPFLSFILGLAVYYILTLLPVVGGILRLIALLLGLGAIVTTRFATYKQARKKGIL